MLIITARLLHGTMRAGSPDDTVMAGGEPQGEWPPSPARLFSALVAADGTRDRCRVTDGAELTALERLGAPTLLADPPEQVVASRLPARFVVKDRRHEGLVQDYPARTAAEVRPGVRLSPSLPLVGYVWDAELPPPLVEALRRRAARVGYLGCADSPVQVTVSTGSPPDGLVDWRPGARTGVALPVPYEGFTAALDHAFDAWSSGRAMRRSWVRTRRERYAPARDLTDHVPEGEPEVIWLELDRAVAGRKALLVSETLRHAVLDHVDRLADDSTGEPGRRAPWQLHGHDIPDGVQRPYQLARFLPLGNVGHRHSNGALLGAAIWLPPGMPPQVVEVVRAAVFTRLRQLKAPGLDVGVAPRRGQRGKWSTQPRRWCGPARRWFSTTPVVAERGRRGGPRPDDVRAWFAHAGHPEPAHVRVSLVPTRPGVTRLSAREVHRAGKERYPFVWIEAEFDSEVEGPLCVGRRRTFGLGLLAPEVGAHTDGTNAEAAT